MKRRLLFESLALYICMTSCISSANRVIEAEKIKHIDIRQPNNSEKAADTVKNTLPKNITYVDSNGKEQTIMTSERDSVTGEDIATVQLQEITVISRSKTVPERNGKINLSFIVTVPGKMILNDVRICFTPVIDNSGEKSQLPPIYITGNEFKKYQNRKLYIKDYNLKNNLNTNELLLKRKMYFNLKDSTKNREKIEEIKREWNSWKDKIQNEKDSLRLDTIIFNGKNFEYYYSQSFQAQEMKKKIKLSFGAKLEDLSGNSYPLSGGDTLNFFISSMTQFLDRAPRYKRSIVERKVMEKTTAYINFKAGDTNVIDTLGQNMEEIEKVRTKMKEITEGNEFIIDSIEMIAGCSPEGSSELNSSLSMQRGANLKKYFQTVLNMIYEDETPIRMTSVGENWNKLLSLIQKDKQIQNNREIAYLISNVSDLDDRERQIKESFPIDYNYIREKIYPELRSVDFVYNLSRKGMVQDTIYTDVIDTLYAHAIQLMDDRNYKEAMPKLLEYRDQNTAICYMSLGYNKMAYDIFAALPQNADIEYMMAILAARLNRNEEAVQRFLHACKMDDSKEMRGEMDPEIAVLIRQYNLTNQLYQ